MHQNSPLSQDMDQLAGLIDRIAGRIDPASVSARARGPILAESGKLIATLRSANDAPRLRLCKSLENLVRIIGAEVPSEQVVNAKDRTATNNALRQLRRTLLAIAAGAAIALPQLVAAAPAINTTIKHPVSGNSLTVSEIVDSVGVIALDAAGNEFLILTAHQVGETMIDPGTGEGTVTVLRYLTADNKEATSVVYKDGQYETSAGVPITQIVYGTPAVGNNAEVVKGTSDIASSIADPGTPSVDIRVPGTSTGDPRIEKIGELRGANGKNGRNGALFVPAAAGKDGQTGKLFEGTLIVGNIDVGGGPGVIIASIGGDGGEGGDGYLGASGKAGGSAGAGGTIKATLTGGTVNTTGHDAHGIVVQSRSGVGGGGGSSYAGSGTGTGGEPSHGGSVTLNNRVHVETQGNNSHGVLGQSLGGGGGAGGSSYGLFGSGASASGGGNGGSVVVQNNANIKTHGESSYGVFAQSVGGTGGDAGSAGGIVALTRSSGAGGNGGSATIDAQSGTVETRGSASHGLFAQSIGGGGGNAGSTSGVVAVGGNGAAGGDGGSATVTTAKGSAVVTRGSGAHAIFAQSIGGGGGNAGKSGGLVSLGGNGSTGGSGGDVSITNYGNAHAEGQGSYGIFGQSIGGGGGTGASSAGLVALGGDGASGGSAANVSIVNGGVVETRGQGGRGIYAQSIGGGGGDASSSAGLVGIGGSGSKGGQAGTVTVKNVAGGRVSTIGDGADGIFAQSVGGGGGSGGGAKGFVGIGGSGSVGGDGNVVSVGNSGIITTSGNMARGILAQSIGGGGGVGGSGGGLISTGGSGGAGGNAHQSTIGGSSDTISNGSSVTITNSGGAINTGGAYSSAIQAQSIGGGGGDGGNAGGTFLTIGGTGGKGGKAGAVNITHSGHIVTQGSDSHGIFAQSIGGGGGSGGSTFSGGLFFSAAIGGTGGAGGNADAVTLNLAGDANSPSSIRTKGDRARGLNLQAIGGGGGNGGASTAISAGLGANASLAIGGKGAGGGAGGTVTANGYVDIKTEGDFAEGAFLQSVGGGGGSGGFSTAVSVSTGVSLALSVGGEAANGGDGGTISMASGGLISTKGDFSDGLIAQSIGGGGGNGGFSIAAAGSAGLIALSASASIGGSGGNGGKGGLVDVDFDGSIGTEGLDSDGALIQSVGGGGGSGGFSVAGAVSVGGGAASGAASLGGSGGNGGVGGNVTGKIGGSVVTKGNQSDGAIIQSVGGGGGSGGFSVSGALAGSLVGSGSAALGIGGAGGGGGGGGNATGVIGAGVATAGHQSIGLIVQSVGGGGGAGGFNVSGGIALSGGGSGSAVVGIGGAGGGGGNAGTATGLLEGGIHTRGDQSGGMLVQSVGGGGGSGGFNVSGGIDAAGIAAASAVVGIGGTGGGAGNANTASGTLTGGALTEGAQSTAVTIQSVGGGGGSGGFNISGAVGLGGTGAGAISVGIGGSGAGGGNAGKANGNLAGDIITQGNQSDGALVQSIGGGGGSGGFDISGALSAAGTGAGTAAIGIGGSGGRGGSADAVNVIRTGNTLTSGAQARGLVAQSIGGGGGTGGFNVSAGVSIAGAGAGNLSLGVGGSGGSGGSAGDVALRIAGAAQTTGEDADAVIAQSIGGGGGSGAFNVTGGVTVAGTGAGTIGVGVGGLGGTGGGAGDVLLDLTGSTNPNGAQIAAITAGNGAGAVLAQSVGGGGGSGGFNVTGGLSAAGTGGGAVGLGIGGGGGLGANGGAVEANVRGIVLTEGNDAAGIVAQSVGGGGGSGGFNITGVASAAGTGAGAVSIGLGGFGGGGGAGSTVAGVVVGDIQTSGARSDGAVYQSLGGGGGSGGFNISGALSAAGTGAGTVAIGIGGSGGLGGKAGNVALDLTGNTLTSGAQARGLVAQSIGGGGGTGGFNVSAGVSIAGAGAGNLSLGVGGSGGSGGSAGDVALRIAGAAQTTGEDADAVIAQSIGGGGGSGAFNVTGGVTVAGTGAGTIGVGVGGLGGTGGGAGDVLLDLTGSTNPNGAQIAAITAGNGAGAVLAQSVGGGGGSGGFNVTGGLSAAGTGGGAVGLGIGGGGGLGANGGAVEANVRGIVLTEGNDAAGIVAQSVGGGGGSGGFNITGVASAAGTGAGTVSIGLGGFGGGGGAGSTVAGVVVGDIQTSGARSDGAVYQSLGGGGGSGGFNISGALSAAGTGAGTVAIGIGGSGGLGGKAGNVALDLTGNTLTSGAQARGLVAQSIGGGGGTGGFNVSGGISGASTGAGALAVGIGGMGGDGGSAGNVILNTVGTVRTLGQESSGIIALSLGGGGGVGGFNVSGGLSVAGTGSGAVGVGVGGFGGGGGDAGDVIADITGTMQPNASILAAYTKGSSATAITAQSIGGGGGTGGFNISGALSASNKGAGTLAVGVGGMGGDGGNAGMVSASVTGNVLTEGHESGAILAQSVGGGGGSGGFNVSGTVTASRQSAGSLSVGLGGFGGGGGDAGDVGGIVTGNIATIGDRSGGATYQSLGGGGGSGGFNVSGGISVTMASSGGGSSGSSGASGFAGNVGIGIGGFGGRGGKAGDVDTTLAGNITTLGKGSYGALFQSAGGGGGNGGFNVTGTVAISNTTSAAVGFGLGGFGGDGGRAGDVYGAVIGKVVTAGHDAFGAMLQSVGGGGGNGGLNVSGALAITASKSSAVAASIGMGGFGGGGGDAGDVKGLIIGDYYTLGDNADGVIAQSLGGGGGNGGLNIAGGISAGSGTSTSVAMGIGGFGGGGGNSGDVSLTRSGNTFTDGANSDGVIAQSIAGGGGNGGMNVSGTVALTLGEDGDANSIALGLGGFGGDGGNAGNVIASVNGDVFATGVGSETRIAAEAEGKQGKYVRENGSNGIIAQSIGGGGGTGGIDIAGAIAIDKPASSNSGSGSGAGGSNGGNSSGASGGKSRAVSLGIGGFGGGGGDAGSVDLTAKSGVAELLHIQSRGDERAAVVAQSIGGGGGLGGINISGGISLDQALQLGIGGFGGDGGRAGEVVANVDAHILAAGNSARGIMAQSIGGGGGSGGINISGSVLPRTEKKQVSVTFGLGGFGGAGNISDDVTVNQSGSIKVDGVDAVGLLAQSIAGGGGSGGLNIAAAINRGTDSYVIAAGVGGFGGDGADAGAVAVSSRGTVLINTVMTKEADGSTSLKAAEYTGGAKGILAQSIGGGGGTGGINVAGVFAPKGNPITLGVGGSGGSGGNAGSVSVIRGYEMTGGVETKVGALLSTFGDHSDGLVAQSIGGGGGNGNYNVSVAATSNNAQEGTGTGSTGGTGGTGGTGSNGSQGSTSNRPAVNLQVGGSGAGAGSGDDVDVRHAGVIATDGLFSDGIVAQSIGGGGGDAGANVHLAKLSKLETFSVGLSLGGGTGAGGTGGDVSVAHDGTILTNGQYSVGVKAQSIGGGGGSAASDISKGADSTASNVTVSIGRMGGAGGAAGNVDVQLAGLIQTKGVGSSGVLAQSIGGGGGDSTAISVDASIAKKQNGSGTMKPKTAYSVPTRNSVSVSVGLEGGVGATGGDVRVGTQADTTIITAGDDARGIHAQSIGGGGGAGGGASSSVTNSAIAVSIAVGGAGGTGATSGQVDIANLADIMTSGAGADGILAQSIGGGGGIGGSAETEVDYEIPTVSSGWSINPNAKPKTDRASYNASMAETGKAVSIALGGSGGVGAESGNVSASNAGVIATYGEKSYGIRAQSIGGGGGIAGSSTATVNQGARSSNTLQLAIGGFGGDGARAGDVDVVNTGVIYTEGNNASAISANSIGGGGGDGGVVSVEEGGDTAPETELTPGGGSGSGAAGNKTATITTRTVSIGIGGEGGTGGAGGNVSVQNLAVAGAEGSGTLVTKGIDAYGIFAQSIGGGGGNGSLVTAVSDLEATETSVSINLAIGGIGGSGNRAGEVSVNNSGIIDTSGKGAHGILAQSIGGGGGNGSMAMAVNAALSGGGAANAASPKHYFLAVGGFGGDGGDAGAVSVDNSGSIVTRGRDAHGIVAQSIGGGGGNAEVGLTVTDNVGNLLIANALSTIVGGMGGGSGGIAGPVTVNHSGDITVLGEGAVAIKAESINGGGGSISLNYEEAMGVAKDIIKDKIKGAIPGGSLLDYFDKEDANAPTSAQPIDPLIAARAGAIDARGSNAGAVTIHSTGTFGVGGDYGTASLSQAIGGGGGSIMLRASIGVAKAVETQSDEDAMLLMASRSFAATASETHVDTLGGAEALGFRIDLGGVDGVDNHGGAIISRHSGKILTEGDNALGILAQSVGGGGGRGTIALTAPDGALVGPVGLTFGATNGANQAGGDVLRQQEGAVYTIGEQAHAALMQSIGGGGGTGEIVLAGPIARTIETQVALGANGGAGSSGGDVSGIFTGGIATTGNRSFGLIAQSIGAGGGEARVSGAGQMSVLLGGTNGTTGDGGAVNLVNDGVVFTDGKAAHGVMLQSIGGGGGVAVSDSGRINYSLATDNIGHGGNVTLDQNGIVDVTGEGSFGVIAQSLGGGGGWIEGVFAGSAGGVGRGGSIKLDLGGNVLATNRNATAIFAQSAGSEGSGDIAIDLTSNVRGGSGLGAGLVVDGGADNRVWSSGSLSSVSGMAMRGGAGNDWLTNTGLLVGNMDLGEGDNRVRNAAGATFIAYDTIKLGGSPSNDGTNSFVNEGQLLMGLDAASWPVDLYNGATFANLDEDGNPRRNLLYGARVINTVNLNGNFVQTATGHMAFDVAFGMQQSDRINVTGNAIVDGKATVTLTSLADAKPITLFATGGIGIDNGLEVANTIALDYNILAGSKGIQLDYDADFGQRFLRPNQQALGRHMDSALTVGESEGISRLMAALGNLMSGQEGLYATIFDELSPEGHMAPLHSQLTTAQSFSSQLFGCAERDEEGCNWVAGKLFDYKRSGDLSYLKVDSSGYSQRFGVERSVSDNWSVSAAFGYDSITHLTVEDGRLRSSGDGVNFGLGARSDGSPLRLSATLSGGWTWFDSTRTTSVFDEKEAYSTPETAYLRTTFELAHLAQVKNWSFRPAMEIAGTLLHHDGFQEKGARTIGYQGLRHDQRFVTFYPNLTFGYERKTGTGGFGFTATTGALIHTTGDLTLPVRFLGSNPSADPAILATPLNKQALTASSRLYYVEGGVALGLNYETEIGDHSKTQRYGVNMRWAF